MRREKGERGRKRGNGIQKEDPEMRGEKAHAKRRGEGGKGEM